MFVVAASEEPEEVGLGGQVLDCSDLQARQRDMGGIEVDRIDLRRRPRQIGERITPARSYGDDAMLLAEFHRFHVDIRILPDLRVDEAGEEKRKEPLGQSCL